jgi:kynurenine formamidase
MALVSGDQIPDLSSFTTSESLDDYIRETSNWGRWGAEDQRGALNLITPESRVRAAELVTEGIAISLSLPLATEPGIGNPRPVVHSMFLGASLEGAGSAQDQFSVACHGYTTTHIDALSHLWAEDGKLYNGIAATDALQFSGATWGGLDQWSEGIFTRGVLLDIAKFRGGYVRQDAPVTAEDLDRTARDQGVETRPGDALIVHSGRTRWDAENPLWASVPNRRPGLDVSCIKYIRAHDFSTLVWDMMDHEPGAFQRRWGVHVVIPAYGVALVDNAKLEVLAAVCDRLGRYEFALSVNPLLLRGGTGSPANPIALL